MAEEQKTAGKGAERQRTASPETAEIRTEGKRKRRFRGLKIALGILLGVWLLVMLVLQLVLTDSFLTQTVNRFAADYVDGELKFGKISASAFRSFPNLNLEIEDALLVYPHDQFAAYDSTGFPHPLRSEGRHPQMDTLAAFRSLSVSVDYMAALRSKINVHKATLDGARIFAHRYDSTAANWSILKFLSTEKTDTSAAPLPDITVGRVALTGSPHIVFTAPSDTLFAEITSKEIRFDGRLRLPDMDKSQLDLNIDALDFAGRLPADSLQVALDRLSLRQKDDRYDIDASARARLALASLGKMDLPIELQAGVSFPEKGFSAISVRDLYLKAAAVELTGEGDVKLRPDSTYIRAEALIDDCKVSDVTTFLGTSILPDLKKLKTDANISLTALCDGWYIPAEKTLPELVAEVSVPKSSLAWTGFDYSGRLAAEVNAETDRYGKLSVTLDGIDLDMAGVNLTGSGFSEDVLCDDPLFGIDLEDNADLDVINDFLPQGMTASGAVNAAVSGMVFLSDLDLNNFSRADLDGHITSPGIQFHDAPDSLSVFLDRTDIRLTKSKSDDMALGADFLGVRGRIDSLYAQYGRTTFIRGTGVGLTAQNAAETISEEFGKEVHPIVGTLTGQSLAMTGADSLFVALKDTRNSFKYSNKTVTSGTVPVVVVSSRNDEVQFRQGVNRIRIQDASLSATAVKREPRQRPQHRPDSMGFRTPLPLDEFRSRDLNFRLDESLAKYVREWDARGSLALGEGLVITPYFPLRNGFSDVKGTFTLDQVNLENLTVTSGQSDVSAQGSVTGLRRALLGNGTVKADLEVSSNLLHANELLAAYDAGNHFHPEDRAIALNERISDAEYLSRVAVDTLDAATIDSTLIVLPSNLEASLHLMGNEIIYSDLDIDWFAADILMKERTLQITNTVATSNMGDIYFEGFYTSKRKDDLTAGFNLNLVDITADKVITLFPVIDSLVPLLKTFKGMLDCEMAATSRLDTTMNLIPSSISGIMKIKGSNLSIEENDAIRKIAKILMFKNKKVSEIDDMSVEGLIADNTLEVFPFILGVDRYQLALSGIQRFDQTFNYHVSVLRSPLPFRFGVNLWGNFDDWKYRIVRAKYKNTNVPVYTARIDTLQVNLVNSIHDIFAKGVEVAVRQNEASGSALTRESLGDQLTPTDSLSAAEQAVLDSLQYDFDHPDAALAQEAADLRDAALAAPKKEKITLIQRIRAFFCKRYREALYREQEALLPDEEQ